MGESPEEVDDHRHLGGGHDGPVRVARVAEVVADPAKQLVVIGRPAHAAAEVSEVLDEQVARTVLANLEVVTPGVDAAEDPRKLGDQQVVLGDVPPHLVATQRSGGEASEVFRAAEGAPREQLRRQSVEPRLGGHAVSSVASGHVRRVGLYSERRLAVALTRRSPAGVGVGSRARTRRRGGSAWARFLRGRERPARSARPRRCSRRGR